jgi:hypothetical protein
MYVHKGNEVNSTMNKTALRDPSFAFYDGEMGVTDALGPILGPGPAQIFKMSILRVDHGGHTL